VVKVITLTELPEGLKGGDITDYLEYHGPEKTLDDLRRYKAEAQEPTDEQLKEQSATQPEESPTTNFKPDLFADKILEGRSVVYYHGGYRLYEGGVYNEWKLWKIKKIIKGMGLGHFKEHHRREILGSLEIETSIDPDCVNPKNLINLKNGLINIDAPHEGLIPHDPRHIHSFQLPIAYDPDAECPRFERFLQEKAPDSDVRALIQEIFGYCLIPSSEFQKAFVFYGGTETGKSTLLHILGALVGKDNRCAVNFGRLTDQFYVRLLDGKLVNITSEVSISEVAAEGVLKEIIAGDEISGARKHQDPYFFTPFCRLILACNDLPKSRDASKAFFRRFLVVPFDIPTPDNQKDPKLAAHIVSHELDGVFQWALAGLQRLKNSGGFTVPESSVEALSEWQVEANPLLKAVLDFMENHAYWNGPATELYEILKDMAREGGYYQKSTWPGNSKELSKRLAKMTDLASHGIRYSRGREKGGRIIRLEVI
jgi:putative DNA primase/helicase